MKLILGVISGFLGAIAFVIANNLPQGGGWTAAYRQNWYVGLQIFGVILLITAVVFLIFYFKDFKKI